MPPPALLVALSLSVAALAIALLLMRQLLRQPTGAATAAIRVGVAIREGALAFLHRQYRTVAVFVACMALLLGGVYFHFTGRTELALRTAVAFVLGAACSAGAGYFGVLVAIRANMRAAHAAESSLNRALQVAIRGGAVNAIAVVGLAIVGIVALFAASGGLGSEQSVRRAPFLLVGYALGASSVALFAQLGGGIYTKAADVGADLVGKLEIGIPEDDPRNPAVIADLVGDNVGDCAGRGADLFESTAAEIVGTMIVAVTLFQHFGERGIAFPLVIGAIGIVASVAGVLVVRTREGRDPMIALNRGYYLTALLVAIGCVAAARWLLSSDAAPAAWWCFAACGWIGVATSLALGFVTQYYSLRRFRPLAFVVEQSKTGPATNVLAGFSVGLGGTLAVALVIAAAAIGAHELGALSGVERGGLFGTAVATSGMLAMATYVLAMDTFGPIVDNAGGIVEMSNADPATRRRTDLLDACGNTTKALTKSYALGSAALAAFLLLSAYLDEVWAARMAAEAPVDERALWAATHTVDLAKPAVFAAGLLGATLVFYFSSRAIRAVGTAARAVIEDVRAQLRERPGIVDGRERPDYARSVDIVTRAALREMTLPALVAVGAPVAVGLAFRTLGVGAEAVAGMLLVTTIVGILFANVLNASGAIWDNAKKAIEDGAEGGKGSDAHRAAVIGDTVGDPFKDTAGPSLHVLVKLVASVALVLVPLFV